MNALLSQMDPILVSAIISLIFACIPLAIFLRNLGAYRAPDSPATGTPLPSVSVLIPARNEELSIREAVESVLASRGLAFEVIVLDDHSEDATRRIVQELAQTDSRVRLENSPPLADGWCGKPHACHHLAGLAQSSYLVFMDADVRLAPDALARMVNHMEQTNVSLASGVPRQITESWSEKLLIPLIHFILMGFLPMRRMRKRMHPSYGAGCGQLFVAKSEDYHKAGGHRSIRQSLHDGVKLPRAFREAGFMTGLFDATPLARCRMYHNASEVWKGLGKNAIEGLAAPNVIVPMTLLLFLGQIVPWLLLPFASGPAFGVCLSAVLFSMLPRLASASLFKQSLLGALLHPAGVLLLLIVQWEALFRWWMKIPSSWKGRQYSATVPTPAARVENIKPVRVNP